MKILQIDNTDISIIEKYPDNLKKFIFTRINFNYCENLKIFDLSVLPKSIEYLHFDFPNAHFINFNLPNLKILKIGRTNLDFCGLLPPTLKYLEISESVEEINENVEEISINHPINYNFFPPDLEYLVLNNNVVTFKNEDIDDNVLNFQEKIQNLKYLSLNGHEGQENILNNLPMNLPVIKFIVLEPDIQIDNLPINLKEIYVGHDVSIQYLKKIPFGCCVHVIKRDEVEIIDNYLINSKYTLTQHPKSISNNILNLDDIGIQYYSIYCR